MRPERLELGLLNDVVSYPGALTKDVAGARRCAADPEPTDPRGDQGHAAGRSGALDEDQALELSIDRLVVGALRRRRRHVHTDR